MLTRIIGQLFPRERAALAPALAEKNSPGAEEVELGKGNFATAADHLRSRLRNQPGSSELLWKMARAQIGIGDVGSALSVLAPIMAGPQLQFGQRRVLEAAIVAFANSCGASEALRNDGAYLLGCVFLEQGEFEAAYHCARVVANDPEGRLSYHLLPISDDLIKACDATGHAAHVSQNLFSVSSNGKREPAYLCTLPGGMVLGHSGIPLSAGKTAYPTRHIHNLASIFNRPRLWRDEMICLASASHLLAADSGVDDYEGTHVLIGNHANPGHWMLNHFGRLRVLEEMPLSADAKLIVYDNISSVALRSLELAGYSEKRLTLIPRGRIGRFELLAAPSMLFGGIDGSLYWSDEVPRFIHRTLTPTRQHGGSRRILVTRKNAQWRRLQNEDELLENLVDLGFEPVDLAKLSLDQQIALAAESDTIVGAFGAGMSIVLLAHPGTVMVEIKATLSGPMDVHPLAAAALGVKYSSVLATAVQTSADPRESLHTDLVCDPAIVRTAVVEAMRAAAYSMRIDGNN